jgi:tetratricopeptide (TPR) repeat protein
LRQQQGPLNEQITQFQNERNEALKQLAAQAVMVAPRPVPTAMMAVAPTNMLQTTNLYDRLLKDKLIKLTREQAEAYLKANGRTATTLLAAFRTSGDAELLQEAMQKFPNDAHVAFEAAMSTSLTPEERQKWLDAFVKAAPNNGLANYLQAASDIKAGRVDECLQELTAAAGKPFDDYTSLRAQNDVEAFLGAGYPIPDAKTLGISGLVLPQLAQLKQLTVNLVDLAKAYQQAGDQPSAQSALQMAVNLGQNYVNSSPGEPLVNQLVGIAIERSALEVMDPNSPYGSNGQTVQDALNQLVRQREAIGHLAQQFEALQSKLSDQDWVNYRDRWLGFGEMAAAQWVVSKYGGDAGK